MTTDINQKMAAVRASPVETHFLRDSCLLSSIQLLRFRVHFLVRALEKSNNEFSRSFCIDEK